MIPCHNNKWVEIRIYNFGKMKSIIKENEQPVKNKNCNNNRSYHYQALHKVADEVFYDPRFKYFFHIQILPGFKIPLGSNTDFICF